MNVILIVALLFVGLMLYYPADAVGEEPITNLPQHSAGTNNKVAISKIKSEGAPLFVCPYLYDESRQTISPISQGNNGWFFRKAGLKNSYQLLAETRQYLKRLVDAFVTQGSQLIILPIPPRSFAVPQFLNFTQPLQADFNFTQAQASYAAYMKQLASTGALVADLRPVVNLYDDKYDMYFFFRRDHHWTPYGANLAAQQLAELINEIAKYDSGSLGGFTTEITEILQMKHSMAKEIQRLCEGKIDAEPYPQYVTIPHKTKGEDALFGDISTAPPIILLGSSFSAQDIFNFAGFISQETGLEVANFAISAGQLFNAITSYVSLPVDERLKPDFIIWEALAHYDFNNGSQFFRQIIPAVGGECSAKEAIATSIIHIGNGGKQVIFDLKKAKNITGSSYFIFLNMSNKELAKFTLELDYLDGDGEWFTIDRSAHFNNSGRFFIELSDEIESSLSRVTIDGFPENITANLEARLCKYK